MARTLHLGLSRTNLLERIDNKIKVLKRMAFSYRDDEYFFLKILDACPGFAG